MGCSTRRILFCNKIRRKIMKNVNTGILLTPTEAREVEQILRFIAHVDDFDEFVGYDIEYERESAKRLYNRLNPLLQMGFLEKIQQSK